MQLVIEKNFLDDFFALVPRGETFWYQDFEYFLKKRAKGFVLSTDFSNKIELFAAFQDNPLWEYVSDNSDNYTFDTALNDSIENSTFYARNSVFKLFCTTKTDVECKDLEEKYGYMYLNINTLKDEWALFQSDRDDASLPIDKTSNPRFDDWAKIGLFKHPIRSMVIFDKYLLVNQVNQDITQNLFKLFDSLLEDITLANPLEILLLVSKEIHSRTNIDKNNRILAGTISINDRIEKIGQYIEAHFNSNYVNLRPKITIVHYDNAEDPTTDKEHDRGVYTNYFFFEIGAGINLFDSSNNLTKRSTLNTHFLLKLPGKAVGFSGLRSFRDYIDSVVTSHGASSLDYFYNYSGNLLLSDSAL